MNINATNPDNPPKNVYKPRKIDWDWRDGVVTELTNLGVPVTIATVAVIDLRPALDKCAKDKETTQSTAKALLPEVERLYNKGASYSASVAQR